MSRVTTRVVSFGDTSVAIEYDGSHGSSSGRIVDLLFSGIPKRKHRQPNVTFRIRQDDTDDRRIQLHRGETLLYDGDSPARLAIVLANTVTEQLASECSRGLLLHAAALGWRGRAVILPGRTGTGKTTLAAWLTKRGFDYLSDELVYLPEGDLTVQPFPRPLTVKTAGLPLVRRLLDLDRHAAQTVVVPEATFIPPTLLGVGGPATDLPVGVTVAFQYEENAPFSLRPLSKAEAGLVLMGGLVNARNLPGHGFGAIAHLAREIPAWKVVYGDPSHVVEPMKALLDPPVTASSCS